MDSYTRTEQYLDGILNGTDVPEPYTREEQLLYDIAKNGGGGGSDLPAVTSVDNGKVLKVINGAWDKGEASGGGGAYRVVFSIDAESQAMVCDKTIREIYAAFVSGSVVIGTFDDPESGIAYVFHLNGAGLGDEAGVVNLISFLKIDSENAVMFSVVGDLEVNDGVDTDSWRFLSQEISSGGD